MPACSGALSFFFVFAAGGGAGHPERLPEPVPPPPQRVERGTGHRIQASAFRFCLPLLLSPV